MGLFAAAFTAASPFLIWYSTEAHAYSLLAFLGAVSVYLFARALQRPSGRTVLTLGIVSALALATHYYAALLFAVEAAILFRRAELRRAVIGAAAIVGAVGLALIPLVLAPGPGRAHRLDRAHPGSATG